MRTYSISPLPFRNRSVSAGGVYDGIIAALENGYADFDDEGAAVANDLARGRIELNDMVALVRPPRLSTLLKRYKDMQASKLRMTGRRQVDM